MASRTSTDPLEILLEMGVDLDNLSEDEDYLSALKEAVATIEFQTKGKGDARSTVLRQEVVKERKRRKSRDTKFNAKKTKISAGSFKKNSATGSSVAPKALPTSAIVSYQAPEAEEDTKAKTKKKEKPTNLLEQIAKSVTNIADTLKDQYNLKKKAGEFDRKKAQRDKRKLNEKNLEKGFSALFKTAQKIIAPVRGIFDRIFGFIANILIGKFLVKLIGWIAKPDNQKKLQNIIQFLGKHWPKLLSLYLVFGTGLGRFIFSLTKTLIGGAVKLTAAIAKLLAARKLRGAGKLARFLGGKKGRLLTTGAATAVTVGGTMLGINALTGEDESQQQTQGFSGGGLVQPIIMLNGGGRVNLNLISPTNNILGYEGGSYVENPGEVSGPGGIDKVPAMLTDGEFVMSRGAVQKYGVKALEGMNAAGGGTNLPKMVKNTIYAADGGYIGDRSGAGSPPGGYSSGSLTSDPLGAIDRMLGQSSGGRVRIPGGRGQDSKPSNSPSKSSSPPPKPRVQPKDPVIPSSSNKPPSSSKQETSKDQTAVGVPERMLKSPTFRDSGLLYLRSMLGGLGGPITESQLSKASRVELNNAIVRAKQRTGSELAFAEQQLKEAKDGGFNKQILAERQSVRDRLKRGEIRVLYQDYYDGNDEKNITPAAENAKSILGQFWATSTERDGHRVVNEKYDFVEMNDPLAVLRGDSRGIAKDPKKAEAGKKITFRQQLQALRQLNPLARDMSVDVVLGEKPNPLRDYGNYLKYTVGGMADALTKNLFDFDKQGGKSLMNPSGKKQEKAREKVDKQLSDTNKMTQAQVLNAQKYAESKGKYYSSSDGKTYESYQAAVDARDVRVNSQANVGSGRDGSFGLGTSGKGMPSNPKFHRGGMVMGKNKPKLPSPGAPMQAKVSVIRIPKTKSNDSLPAPRGGSRTPDINAGNGSASKRKILGIV